MGRFSMTRSNIAITALSLIALIFISISANNCGRGNRSGVDMVIVDTSFIENSKDSVTEKPAKTVKKNKAPKSQKTPAPPSSRNYLDEPVD